MAALSADGEATLLAWPCRRRTAAAARVVDAASDATRSRIQSPWHYMPLRSRPCRRVPLLTPRAAATEAVLVRRDAKSLMHCCTILC